MDRPEGLSIILLNSKKQVLLFLRDDKSSIPFPNTWDLLGGHPEDNESPEEGIRREMQEEIELELGEIYLFREYRWEDYQEYIFWKELDLDLTKTKLHEGQRLAYFSKENIKRTQLAFHANQVLDDFFDFLESKENSLED
jgi:8-oxo-dGTP diphosphatase